jgi:hypothetical protein
MLWKLCTTSWRCMEEWMYRSKLALVGDEGVSFTPRQLYPRGKSPRFPLDRRLGGLQSRSARGGENSWPYRDLNSDRSAVQPVASCIIPDLWKGDKESGTSPGLLTEGHQTSGAYWIEASEGQNRSEYCAEWRSLLPVSGNWIQIPQSPSP